MSYKAIIQANNAEIGANNAELQSLINTANSLPNAGDADPVLQDITITANGTYHAEEGYDGFGTVNVDVVSDSAGAEVYYSALGQLYTPHMVIPAGNMRYVRDHFNNAVNLVSYIQQYGTPSLDSDYGLFSGCTALETVWVSRATFGNYFFRACSALKEITLGRVGLAVTSISAAAYDASCKSIETITCYVAAETIAAVPSAVSSRITPSASPDATIIYRNSITGEVISA